jgi:hypothetical protein
VTETDTARLQHEARVACRYLVGDDCPPDLIERYVRANRDAPDTVDPVARFAFDRPWSIPFLDAASALSSGGEELRRKLYVMAAVLEASPPFASHFLPRTDSPTATVAALVLQGSVAAFKVILGTPLLRGLRSAR